MSERPFRFYSAGRLIEGDLSLELEEQNDGDPVRGFVPSYGFVMRRTEDGHELGRISLRVGNPPQIVLYAGHIGYAVQEEHRGHHFAARACRLLMPLARVHGLSPLWITCNPENLASRRTCELAGAQFVEIVDLPPDNDMFARGERQKCRYRLDV